jgi:hypothetical protein
MIEQARSNELDPRQMNNKRVEGGSCSTISVRSARRGQSVQLANENAHHDLVCQLHLQPSFTRQQLFQLIIVSSCATTSTTILSSESMFSNLVLQQ